MWRRLLRAIGRADPDAELRTALESLEAERRLSATYLARINELTASLYRQKAEAEALNRALRETREQLASVKWLHDAMSAFMPNWKRRFMARVGDRWTRGETTPEEQLRFVLDNLAGCRIPMDMVWPLHDACIAYANGSAHLEDKALWTVRAKRVLELARGLDA